jgi:serine/threonine-protein kinase RsbW
LPLERVSHPPDTYRRSLTIIHEPARLREIRRFVDEVAAEIHLDGDRAFDLKVAVSEACANAAEHAGADRFLEICASIEAGRLLFEIRDGGDFRLPALGPDGLRANRGLGLPLMVALMDEVRFHKLAEGGTVVSLALLLPTKDD